jgi:hypothetical protein
MSKPICAINLAYLGGPQGGQDCRPLFAADRDFPGLVCSLKTAGFPATERHQDAILFRADHEGSSEDCAFRESIGWSFCRLAWLHPNKFSCIAAIFSCFWLMNGGSVCDQLGVSRSLTQIWVSTNSAGSSL